MINLKSKKIKAPKLGAIISSNRHTVKWVGTVEELTESFSYTLLVGASYSYEKGNKKINKHPKTVASLVKELEKSLYNSGNSGSYSLGIANVDDIERYQEEGHFSVKIE